MDGDGEEGEGEGEAKSDEEAQHKLEKLGDCIAPVRQGCRI